MIGLPSLEYQHAFDLSAARIGREDGKKLVVASNAFYAREAITRLRGPQLIAQGWQLDDTFAGVHVTTLADVEGPFNGIIWSEPLRDTAADTLPKLLDLLAPGGALCVISSGALSRFLPPTHAENQVPLKWANIQPILNASSLKVERAMGFHGVVSIAWSYGFRLMNALNRLDLADRCLYKMRSVYAVPDGRACTLHTAITVKGSPA